MNDKPATEQDLLAIAQGQAEILGRAEAALRQARDVLWEFHADVLADGDNRALGAISAIDRSLGEIAGSREVTKLGGDDAG